MATRSVIGQPVGLSVLIKDKDGVLADAGSITCTVRSPDGSTASWPVTHDGTGEYSATFVATLAGRHVAYWVVTGLNASAYVDVFDVTDPALAYVTLAELREYLGETSATDGDLLDALAAEQAAQARRCRIDVYAPDLLQALLRRVARNLAARAVPIATFTSFEGGTTSARVPQLDAEVVRLEAPYRRRPVG